jgi:hypothetical protein
MHERRATQPEHAGRALGQAGQRANSRERVAEVAQIVGPGTWHRIVPW